MRPHNRKEIEDGIKEMAVTTFPADIAKKLNVTDSLIYTRAKQMGITLLRKRDRYNRIKEFIRENYHIMTYAEIAARFNKTQSNIYWHAGRIGVKCKNVFEKKPVKKVHVVRKGMFNDKAFSAGNYENLFIGSWQLS